MSTFNLVICISALIVFIIIGVRINLSINHDILRLCELEDEREKLQKKEREEEVFEILNLCMIREIEIYLQEEARKE
ncbi:MAG: hypothetical protein WCI63_03615 [bacterium]